MFQFLFYTERFLCISLASATGEVKWRPCFEVEEGTTKGEFVCEITYISPTFIIEMQVTNIVESELSFSQLYLHLMQV
jgi:hypothetical protein